MLWKKNPLLMCQSGSPINIWSPLLLPLNYARVLSKKKNSPSSVPSAKKSSTCSLCQNSSFLVSSSIFNCWRQLTYQWSFTKFPTCFIVDFQPWKSFHSQPQFSCVHQKIQTSRIHLLHETTFKGTLHMQPYIPQFIHGDL